MTIWANFYEHPDYRGRSAYASLLFEGPSPATYGAFSKSWFDSLKLNDRVSSLKVQVSNWEEGGDLFVFRGGSYNGNFAQFTAFPGNVNEVPSLKPVGLEDRISSAILVRRFSGQLLPIALGDFGNPSLREQVAEFIDGVDDLKPRGEPIITWDMWPSFEPSRQYVYIRVPAKANVPNWWDYDVEIRLWIYLYVDTVGRARGFVDWYGVWVEGGPFQGQVKDKIMERLPDEMPAINRIIREGLEPLQSVSLDRLILLPGRGSGSGHTNDDVSILLVKS